MNLVAFGHQSLTPIRAHSVKRAPLSEYFMIIYDP